MKKCKPVTTPMELDTKFSRFEGGDQVNGHGYRSLVGSLQYLTCTRPNIAYSVAVVSRYMEDLRHSHL